MPKKIMKDASKYQDGSVSLYASAVKCPDPDILDEMCKTVFDCYYKIKWK